MKKRTLLFLLLLSGQAHAYLLESGHNTIFYDLLVWKLREGSAENWAQTITPADTTRSVTLHDAPFPWDSGFRIGLSRNLDNIWDVSLSYTHYQTTGIRGVDATSGVIDSAYIGNFFANNATGAGFGPSYSHADMNWRVGFNTIDLTLSHGVVVDSILIVRPIIGIKAAIINQTLRSSWQNPSETVTFYEAKETLKNNFWGIGPSIGLETIWPIYQRECTSLNLSGKVSAALVAGHWRFKDNYFNDASTSVTVLTDSLYSATSMANGFIGLGWQTKFSNFKLMVQLGYEAQVWFNQLQYYSYNMGKLNHLMSLQGGVLDFYVNF